MRDILRRVIADPASSKTKAIAKYTEAELRIRDAAVVPFCTVHRQGEGKASSIAVKGHIGGYVVRREAYVAHGTPGKDREAGVVKVPFWLE